MGISVLEIAVRLITLQSGKLKSQVICPPDGQLFQALIQNIHFAESSKRQLRLCTNVPMCVSKAYSTHVQR